MSLTEKCRQFFHDYCLPSITWVNPNSSFIPKRAHPPSNAHFMKSELKNYKQVSLTYSKPIK